MAKLDSRRRRLCVALVFERRIGLVRGHCAAKAPPGIVDDLASLVYERFVRAVYTQPPRWSIPRACL